MVENEIKTKQQACDESFVAFTKNEDEEHQPLLARNEEEETLFLKGTSAFMGGQYKSNNIGPKSVEKGQSGRANFPNIIKIDLALVTDAYVAQQSPDIQKNYCSVSDFGKKFNLPIKNSLAHSKLLNDHAQETKHALPLSKILKDDPIFIKNSGLARPALQKLDKADEIYAETLQTWLEPNEYMHPDEARDLAIYLGAVGAKSDLFKTVGEPDARAWVKVAIHSDILKPNEHKLREFFINLTNHQGNPYGISDADKQRALYLYENSFKQLLAPAELGLAPGARTNLDNLKFYPDSFWDGHDPAKSKEQVLWIAEKLKSCGLPDFVVVSKSPHGDYVAVDDGLAPPANNPDDEAMTLSIIEMAVMIWVEKKIGERASDEWLFWWSSPKDLPMFAILDQRLVKKKDTKQTLTGSTCHVIDGSLDEGARYVVAVKRDIAWSVHKAKMLELMEYFERKHFYNQQGRAAHIHSRLNTLLNRTRDGGHLGKTLHANPDGCGWATGHRGENAIIGGGIAYYIWKNIRRPPTPPTPPGTPIAPPEPLPLPQLRPTAPVGEPPPAVEPPPEAPPKAPTEPSTESAKRMRVSELFGIRITQQMIEAGMVAVAAATVIRGLAIASRFSGRRLSGAMAVTGVGLLAAGGTLLAGEGLAWAGEAASEGLTETTVVNTAELVSIEDAAKEGIIVEPLATTHPTLAKIVDAIDEGQKETQAKQAEALAQGARVAYGIAKETFSNVTESVGNFFPFLSKK